MCCPSPLPASGESRHPPPSRRPIRQTPPPLPLPAPQLPLPPPPLTPPMRQPTTPSTHPPPYSPEVRTCTCIYFKKKKPLCVRKSKTRKLKKHKNIYDGLFLPQFCSASAYGGVRQHHQHPQQPRHFTNGTGETFNVVDFQKLLPIKDVTRLLAFDHQLIKSKPIEQQFKNFVRSLLWMDGIKTRIKVAVSKIYSLELQSRVNYTGYGGKQALRFLKTTKIILHEIASMPPPTRPTTPTSSPPPQPLFTSFATSSLMLSSLQHRRQHQPPPPPPPSVAAAISLASSPPLLFPPLPHQPQCQSSVLTDKNPNIDEPSISAHVANVHKLFQTHLQHTYDRLGKRSGRLG